MRPRAARRIALLLTLATLWGVAPVRLDAAKKPAVRPPEAETGLSKKWTVLHAPSRGVPATMSLPEGSSLESLEALEFVGPSPGHPFAIGNVSVDGQWGIRQGCVTPVDGKNTALKIATAEDFELEGIVNAQGLGGWFLIVGWDGRGGHFIANVEMKTKESGSPWSYFQIVDGQLLPEKHGEISRHAWRGAKPMTLSVVEGKLRLRVGDEDIAKELILDGYAGGDVIIGTYDTKYGPKPLQIQSLRIRGR